MGPKIDRVRELLSRPSTARTAHAAPVAPAKTDEVEMWEIADHARRKGMWGGTLERIEVPGMQGVWFDEKKAPAAPADGVEAKGAPTTWEINTLRVGPIQTPHTPALLKVFDELIVNTSDHERACRANKKVADRVSYITVEFDEKTGAFTIENDGPGLPVTLHAVATGKSDHGPIYSPEVAFSYFLAGNNLDKALDNVKGGTNGVGAKLANVHSEFMRVETVDSGHRWYAQEWRDRMRARGEPEVITKPDRKLKPHTRITINPAYGELGYAAKGAKGASAADLAELDGWMRLRTHMLAAYVGPKVNVTYNGRRCVTTSAAKLADLYCTTLGEAAAEAVVVSLDAKAADEPYKKHPWDIAIVILPSGAKKSGPNRAGGNVALVNGVQCGKGAHLTHLRKVVSDAVVERIASATKKKTPAKKDASERKMGVTDTMSNVRIVMCGALPGAEWNAQNKEELNVPLSAVSRYKLAAKPLKHAATLITERLLNGDKSKRRAAHIDKYVRARFSGSRPVQCALLAAEGDSALLLLRQGLSSNKGAARPANAPARYLVPSYDYCGTITLGGVVMNAMRETSEVETSTGDTLQVRSDRLQKNIKLKAIVDAMGLDYRKTYATDAELATLNYGYLYGCVDQDLDGCGKIMSLLMVFCVIFWPNLLLKQRVGQLHTPVIRMFPRGRVARGGKRGKKAAAESKDVAGDDLAAALAEARGDDVAAAAPVAGDDEVKDGAREMLEFQYEEEARAYMREHPDWADYYQPPKYYKGLAAHEDDDVKRMFAPAEFNKNLHLFSLDEGARALFDLYFGGGPGAAAARRAELATPVEFLTYEEALAIQRSRLVPCTRHLTLDTKAYKQEAVRRQIPHALDGLNPARRKVAFGALRIFGVAGRSMKVFQLAGRVAAECFYHHGDASLNNTIICMAQCYPGGGARYYPLLVGEGQFGSRHQNGDDAGSPRYVGARLSPLARALFPRDDHALLPYEFEEGERAEPRYFVSDVPLAVLESGGSRPSEGWAHRSHARDRTSVRRVVDLLLSESTPTDPLPGKLRDLAERLYAAGPTEALLEEVNMLERRDSRLRLPPELRGHFGDTPRTVWNVPHSFGRYEWNAAEPRKLRVVELPLGMPTGDETSGFIGALRGTRSKEDGKASARAAHIERIDDYSTDVAVDVLITLKPGAAEAIQEEYGDAAVDPFEDFLKLHTSLRAALNFVGAQGTVLEFGSSYLAVLLYWFPARRALHRERLDREHVLLTLRIHEQEMILYFLQDENRPDLNATADDGAAAAALAAAKYPALDTRLLHAPGYTPTSELDALARAGPGAGHDYLLDLRERDFIAQAIARREEKLNALRAELAACEAALAERPFAGVSAWRAGVAAFDTVVERGIATGWKFKADATTGTRRAPAKRAARRA